MAIMFEPGEPYSVWFETDKDDPIETRRMFHTTAQSIRKHREILRTIDFANYESLTLDEAFDIRVSKLLEVLTGWSNFNHKKTGEPIPFCRESVEEFFTYDMAKELLLVIGRNQGLRIEEKKA